MLLRIKDPEYAGPEENQKYLNTQVFVDQILEDSKTSELDRWTVNRICEIISDPEGGIEKPCSINIYPSNMLDEEFSSLIRCKLDELGDRASNLHFEILEREIGHLSNFSGINKFIDMVHEYGCEVALDDFGAAHDMSTTFLDELNIDAIKIDGDVMINGSKGKTPEDALDAICTYTRRDNSRVKVIAERMSDDLICDRKNKNDIVYAQCWSLGRPSKIPVSEAETKRLLEDLIIKNKKDKSNYGAEIGHPVRPSDEITQNPRDGIAKPNQWTSERARQVYSHMDDAPDFKM
jgi:EAL domain-containing protein (putative c-di-GMP-specific phosphodiesterase class I)